MHLAKTPFLTTVTATFLGLIASRALPAEIVTVPVTLTLNPPAATAPGANHLRIQLNGGIIGNDSDTSQVSGTVNAIVRLDVDDPDNPVVVGIRFLSGDIAFQDVDFKLAVFLISNIDITGTGIGATIFTPSGKPEPVSGNSFDASLHTVEVNEGTLEAMGTALGQPVNELQDLSVTPLSGPGDGTGTTSISVTSSTPITYTYAIGISVPVLFQDSIPVAGGLININTTIEGSFAATGPVTVVVLPELKPLGMTPSGFELAITGKAGANVILAASDNLVTWTDIATVTLPVVAPYVDAGAVGLPRRYYRFRKP